MTFQPFQPYSHFQASRAVACVSWCTAAPRASGIDCNSCWWRYATRGPRGGPWWLIGEMPSLHAMLGWSLGWLVDLVVGWIWKKMKVWWFFEMGRIYFMFLKKLRFGTFFKDVEFSANQDAYFDFGDFLDIRRGHRVECVLLIGQEWLASEAYHVLQCKICLAARAGFSSARGVRVFHIQAGMRGFWQGTVFHAGFVRLLSDPKNSLSMLQWKRKTA